MVLATQSTHSIRDVFIETDDGPMLDNPDLKGSNNQDYYRRLIILYLFYRKEAHGQDHVQKPELRSLLERVGWYNPNAYKILNETDLFWVTDDTIRLRGAARQAAIRYLDEMADDTVEGAPLPNGQKGPRAAKGTEGQQDSSGKKQRSARASIQEELKTWDSLDWKVQLSGSVSELSSLDKAVMGLWAYAQTQNGKGTAIGRDKISSFLAYALSIDIDGTTVARALDSAEGRELVTHVPKKGYRLRPAGEKRGAAFFANDTA